MTIAPVDLANVALARIGETAISSLTDNSPQARVCSRLYAYVVQIMFCAKDWRFCTAYASLSASGSAPYPWTQQYQMPPGVWRTRAVVPSAAQGALLGQPMPFEEGIGWTTIGGVPTQFRAIWTNIAPATLIYTAEVDDPTLWDAGFTAAFTVQYAAEICLALTGKGDVAAMLRKEAAEAIQALMPMGQAQAVTPFGREPSTTTLARS